jgi:hypothetical protein
LLKGKKKNSPFGLLIKRIRLASFRELQQKRKEEEEDMRFQKRNQNYNRATFQPVLPLVPVSLPDDDDKTKYISFDLKVRTGAGAGTSSYKKHMRTFEEGSPQEWMDTIMGFKEVWKQNAVNGASDRAATVGAILKGDSLSAFETALEDARVDHDLNDDETPVPIPLTVEHVDQALAAVTTLVFPFRALENQRNWMNRYMRKPPDLSAALTVSGLTRLNNYLPFFPGGSMASKFSESELVAILEFSIPTSWRKALDMRGLVIADLSKKLLVEELERIERNIVPNERERENKSNNNKNNKKNKFEKSSNNKKKMDEIGPRVVDSFFVSSVDIIPHILQRSVRF